MWDAQSGFARYLKPNRKGSDAELTESPSLLIKEILEQLRKRGWEISPPNEVVAKVHGSNVEQEQDDRR